ncbi:HEAT repeat domain-containing protein [Candidatus Entotheonella palauensis]|uniref:PBS lyase n=1 Tax=Candidatus Entotheonella gemina TaxID=1429439 RepID=W4MB12_9BACT|nr:HEAT repeat domain-containing protein [Candidatus Entotheonella palauensis]ETX07360.1 MAG: hypothetical protein ETSY2_11690 [Candidatus Entotheonella gemina]
MTFASQADAPDISQLLHALRSDSFWVRERAAEALGHSRSQDAIADLVGALEDTTSTVRERAAEALARIGSEQALAGLFDTLGEEKANEILARARSNEAVDRAHQAHSEQTIDQLQKDLRHEFYARRWRAAQALWKFQGSQVVEDLLQALQEPAPELSSRILDDSISSRPDEYILFDALYRRDFQAAWYIARDLARINSDYAAIVFERVLELTS